MVLTGAGRAFSAGGDLDHLEEARQNPALFYEDMRQGKKLIFSLLDCDKPVICRLNGDAVGLGATIALFCDIIIAADDARIGDPHVRVGYAAGDGGAVIWPQLIGYARAKQYLLTGDLISAKEAQQIGLINFAVPRDELDATVDKWASRLARGATLATRWTKTTINVGLKQLASAVLEPGLVYEALCGRTEDHAEALESDAREARARFHGTMTVADQRPNALITGASGGIGRAVAIELARRGYALGLLYRSGAAAAEAAADAARALGVQAFVAAMRPARCRGGGGFGH